MFPFMLLLWPAQHMLRSAPLGSADLIQITLRVCVLDSVPAVVKTNKTKRHRPTTPEVIAAFGELSRSIESDRKSMVHSQTHRGLRVSQTQLKVQQSFWLDAQLRAQHLHQRRVVLLRLRRGDTAQRSSFQTEIRHLCPAERKRFIFSF